MTDANELYESVTRELNNEAICDTGEIKDEQERFSFHRETVPDDIPPSLLSYFEASKSRAAAVCETFILEEVEDLTASHRSEDIMNFPSELDKDMMKLNKQVTCETEYEENSSSAETHLLLTPTETEAFFTHNVSLCPNNKDEAETDEYMGSEKYLEFEVRTLESSMKEEEIKKSNEYRREHRERRHCEEMKKEEQRRQKERDFQEELKKIMEAEKLQQRELELMQKRAQERLEQEFRLQQELISNLQKRVEEERKMREEEQKRIKEEGERKRQEEEEKRKREEEGDRRKREEMIKREMERKKEKEETRRKKVEEEKRKIEEMRIQEKHRRKKEEEQRKKEEEEKRRVENEEKRKREEEKNKMEEDIRKKEEERKIKEIRLKEEEKRQVEEEERKEREHEEKKEEREKNRKKEEEEETRKREEEKNMTELARKKIEEDRRRKTLKEEGKKEKEEGRNTDDKDKRREEDVRTTTEPEVRVKHEEMRKKVEERKSEEETRKAEVEKKMMVKQMKRKEEEKRKLKEDKEKRKKDEERRNSMECKDIIRMEEEKKTKVEEQRKWRQKEEEEEEYSNMGEEIWNKVFEAESRMMEHERKTQDKEKMQEEVNRQQEDNDLRKREDGKQNIEADKRQIKEDVSKNKEENKGAEEESNNTEKEERLVRANELQEKKRRNDSMKAQNESRDTENTTNHLTSHLEDRSTLTTSDPAPLHSESTVRPTSSETVQQHDLSQDISQTSTCKTNDRQDAAAKPCTSSGSLAVCLPDDTEQKRLSWMNDCIPWSKLSLQNKRKQREGVRSRRGLRKSEASSLPPLCPRALLQSVGCKSLHEVTSVTLEDLPGCSLSTLAQCTRLQSLTLRRCGIKSLEGISQLPQLCHIDVQENAISFVDCENMTSLRVLLLGRNKLTSIHGLSGAENLDALDLSHNSITRIAGLESMRSLQRLSVDHNQLISTKGLRDVYTLLHLDCSHNHLAAVEGLENSALLQSLDLSANSLTEPPGLNNHVLLRELHLDDNSISSLQGLVVCWLPLMHHLSVAQNRITLLPSMSDFVSLANLDLRFNCMSELQNACGSLEGCQFLREVHLTGNPLQQENGWRSTLQKAAAGLRAIDGQETDFILSAPAVQQHSSASGSFLTFCQAQLKQTCDLQQQHSRDLSDASSPLDAVRSSCRHFTETLKVAVDQRFAHEYGDTTVSAGQTTPENTLDLDGTNAGKHAGHSEMESKEKVPPVIQSRSNINCNYRTSEEKSSTESWRDTLDTVTTALETGHHSSALKGKSASSPLETAPVSNHQDLSLKKSTAAVVIQQQWRKYRQRCGNISSPPTAETGGGRGGDGGKPESGPSYINGTVIGQDYAATVIQASWRGFTLRRRLASALAAVTCPDSGEDETFEEVDVDEFVFDEAAVEQHWTLLLSEDSPSRRHSVSEQPVSLKPPGPFPDSSESTLLPPPSWRPKQAWAAGEQVDATGQRITPESSNRSKSPASTSALSGLSARSEKVLEEWGFTDSHTALLMLRRAQKMKSKKPQQKKHRDPSVCLALFRNCNYQRGPVEARNRPAPRNRNYIKVCGAELGLQQAEKTEQVEQERAEQWLHSQSDRDSESEHFLPEISSDILNGGRVQLVADPGYTERLHHASGLWASSSLAAQPSKERNYPRRNSLGHARKEAPSPKQVASAPSKKERISFRDNPVQLSGGWGGGKKRDRVYK